MAPLEIRRCERRAFHYTVYSIPWPMMSRERKEPMHRRLWYWTNAIYQIIIGILRLSFFSTTTQLRNLIVLHIFHMDGIVWITVLICLVLWSILCNAPSILFYILKCNSADPSIKYPYVFNTYRAAPGALVGCTTTHKGTVPWVMVCNITPPLVLRIIPAPCVRLITDTNRWN